jgi:hypothetical protein
VVAEREDGAAEGGVVRRRRGGVGGRHSGDGLGRRRLGLDLAAARRERKSGMVSFRSTTNCEEEKEGGGTRL